MRVIAAVWRHVLAEPGAVIEPVHQHVEILAQQAGIGITLLPEALSRRQVAMHMN